VNVRIVERFVSKLPPSDMHPYRTGAWRPNLVEYDATDLDVVAGEIPKDLEGVYLRNTENPLFEAIDGRYHPFDGDGMLHAIHFHEGKADYKNRFVRTQGLAAELELGQAIWAGILESPERSERDGWGARTRMKDASSTDVVVHAGVALTSFYQCGDLYRLDPRTMEQLGPADWGGRFPKDVGVSAHTKVDERTGELLFFNYGKQAPYMHYGVVSPKGELVHYVPIPLPGPRLPHDMAFTENFSILSDFPIYWDPARLEENQHRARFFKETPSRFAVIPRRGTTEDIQWFEADPTYVLHYANAYEDGDEIVLDGYHQGDPLHELRPGESPITLFMRSLDMHELKTRLHRWRFNRKTGTTKEEVLDDACTEFPTINGAVAGRRHRYVYSAVGEPGFFLFSGLVRYDLEGGGRQEYRFPKGVFCSESPMAPRTHARGEDDGYLVTFVTDMNRDVSECQIFDASAIDRGPIGRVALPERISSGTHAHWASAAALVG